MGHLSSTATGLSVDLHRPGVATLQRSPPVPNVGPEAVSHVSGGPMPHTPRRLHTLGLLVAAVAATAALWVAASPPATSTMAPAAVGQGRLP